METEKVSWRKRERKRENEKAKPIGKNISEGAIKNSLRSEER